MTNTRRRWVVPTVAAAVATVVGVGVASRQALPPIPVPTPLSQAAGSSPSAVPSPLSQVDVAFIATMAAYQHRVLELAGLATAGAHNPDARALAVQIQHSHQHQADSLAALSAQDTAIGTPLSAAAPRASSFAGPTVPVGDDDVRMLEGAARGDFDKLLVALMIRQDQACLELASDEQQHGLSTPARTFAGAVVDTNTAEIAALMNLTGWL